MNERPDRLEASRAVLVLGMKAVLMLMRWADTYEKNNLPLVAERIRYALDMISLALMMVSNDVWPAGEQGIDLKAISQILADAESRVPSPLGEASWREGFKELLGTIESQVDVDADSMEFFRFLHDRLNLYDRELNQGTP
jgi:hypothetical protein